MRLSSGIKLVSCIAFHPDAAMAVVTDQGGVPSGEAYSGSFGLPADLKQPVQ
jgi:hypothetical protein